MSLLELLLHPGTWALFSIALLLWTLLWTPEDRAFPVAAVCFLPCPAGLVFLCLKHPFFTFVVLPLFLQYACLTVCVAASCKSKLVPLVFSAAAGLVFYLCAARLGEETAFVCVSFAGWVFTTIGLAFSVTHVQRQKRKAWGSEEPSFSGQTLPLDEQE